MAIYNEDVLRNRLMEVYRRFLENKRDNENLREIEKLEIEYAGLSTVNDHLSSMPISKEIVSAIGGLSDLWINSFNKSEQEIESNVQKILESLIRDK